MGSIVLTILNTAISSLLKFLILTVSTYLTGNLIIYFIGKSLNWKY
jgi:preprotein translocase subunit SecF